MGGRVWQNGLLNGLLVSFLLFLPYIQPTAALDEMDRELTLIVTGNLAGQLLPHNCELGDVDDEDCFGGAPRVQAHLNQRQAQAQANNQSLLTIDLGNYFSGSDSYRYYSGAASIDFFVNSSYDVAGYVSIYISISMYI